MTELHKKVLEEIGKRQLAPRPYAYFLAKRSVFWAFAVLSVALGALSIAVIIFAVHDLMTTGGRGFDEMPLDDVLAYMPYVWIISLGAFVASAAYSIRRTRRGYRFGTAKLTFAALGASLVLGVLLYSAGAGSATHAFLTRNLPIYDQLTRGSESRRNAPNAGFLAGRVVAVDSRDRITVLDFDGQTWIVDLTGAEIQVGNLLTDEDVAVEGRRTGAAEFRGRLIRDWD